MIDRSSSAAASMAALNFITFPTSGTIMRFDCFAALSEIPYQRFLFASSFFASSFTTARSVSTGTIFVTPSSTHFWMINSILSAFGSPWYRVTCTGSSVSSTSSGRISRYVSTGSKTGTIFPFCVPSPIPGTVFVSPVTAQTIPALASSTVSYRSPE